MKNKPDAENLFFSFVKPLLQLIDNGRLFYQLFRWLYAIIGVSILCIPILLILTILIESYLAISLVAAICSFLVWTVISLSCWIGFQILWNRKDTIYTPTSEDDKFIITPMFAHFIQTLGESFGSILIINGFGLSIIALIFGGIILGKELFNVTFFKAILTPFWGFLIIVFTRFLAEQVRAITTIANNTSKE